MAFKGTSRDIHIAYDHHHPVGSSDIMEIPFHGIVRETVAYGQDAQCILLRRGRR